MKTINVIAAVDEKFGFGKDGKIPWHHPEDFKFFKRMTEGHTVIMGRNTYIDLLTYSKVKDGTVLPGRECIVVTSDLLPHELAGSDGHRGITLECKPQLPIYRASTISDALNISRTTRGDVFFIGGERIFDAGLNMADCVYLTVVPGDHDCDRFFPQEKLRNNFQIYNKREGDNGLEFRTYIHNIWGPLNPPN